MKKIIVLFVMIMLLTACGNEPKAEVQKIDCITKNSLVSEGAILIDVRSSMEFEQGHLKDAINIDVEAIKSHIEEEVSDKNTKIIVYCRSGNRSNTAANYLIDMGYTNVYDLGAMSSCSN